MASRSRRQFAPLKIGSTAGSHLPKLRGIVFDVDGTLCQPQNYMFAEMRKALNITKKTDILEHVYSLPTPEAREQAMEAIRDIERTAMASQKPQPGLVQLMTYLDDRGIPKGICTRNFDTPVNHLLTKFLSEVEAFHPIVTREFRPPKPDPAGILHIASSWGLTKEGSSGRKAAVLDGERIRDADASGLIMVGDSIDDMTAGRKSGAATVLLVNSANEHLVEHEHTDVVISRLDELIGILEEGFKGREF
ncbi:HAD-like protein [Cryphonectria parasitica EP155]|uniref:HAD-like protein n=1 Tax=Cryphonectria parasitica (strain ATCC 38755 / EP155) TaxID=660469 RepID=A0A9P4XUN1_CRYP1|nr:HAD-like protein [Cryphonectria parasitica EP155]KAF3760935.1 HAD-like protein [Cryphonectria parasitica EP155]